MVVRRPFFLLILVSFWDIRELKMSQPFSNLNKILIFPWWMVFYNQKCFSSKSEDFITQKTIDWNRQTDSFILISRKGRWVPPFFISYTFTLGYFLSSEKKFRKVLVFFAIPHRFEIKISSQNWQILYFDRHYFKEKVMRNIYFCQFYIHWTA